jgi:PAS domain S-box-containing protein
LAVSRDQVGEPSLRALIAGEDIHERKQAQDRLQQSEQRWQTAFENSAIGIMMRDRADRFFAANRAFLNLLGYTESELYQLRQIDVTCEEDRELDLELIGELWEGRRQHFQIEKRYRRKDGTLVWVRNNVALVPGTGGAARFLFTIVEDITQRKEDESERRYSEEKYRVVVEAASDAVICVDDAGAILLANPATTKVFGYDPADLIGKPLTMLMPEYLRHLHEGGFRRYLATGQRHLNWQGTELTGVRKNGQELPVEISFGEVTAEGHRIFTGFVRDISEKKRAEESLRRSESYLAQAQILSHTGSFGCKVSTGEMRWSEETFRIFAYDRATKPAVERILQRVHPEDKAMVQEYIERATRDGTDCDLEYRLLLPDDSVKHVRVVAHALKDEAGTIEFVGAVMDVTATKQAEEKLRRSEAYLAEAQKLSHTGSFGWDVSSGGIYWSRETFRIFEYEPTAQASLDQIVQRTHPEDRSAVQQLIERVSRERKEWDFEHRLLMPDGSVKYLRVMGHPSPGESGKFEFVGAVTDITERRRAEEELRRSENYLAQAQRLTHTASWAWQVAGGGPVHLSEEWYRIFGFDIAEGMPAWEKRLQRVHPADRAKWQEVIERAIREKSEYDMEYRILLPDGTVKWINAVGHPVFNASGDLAQFMGTSMDITERKRAEQELRRSENYLAQAQRLTRTGSWVSQVAGKDTIHASQEWYRILGFDPAEGMPSLEKRLQRVHPTDRARLQEVIERAIREKSEYELEYRIFLPDGSVKWIHGIGHPIFNASGDLVEFMGSSTDITERKRADEALRRSENYLAEAQRLAHIAAWVWGATGKNALYLSDEWYRIYAFDPRNGLPTWEERLERVHPEDRARWTSAMDRAVANKADYEVDFRIVVPGIGVKHIHTEGHPVCDPDGELVEFVGVSIDVTERKQAEEERERLRQAQFELAHINRVSTMGELTASLAHETKQPISAASADAETCFMWLARDQPDLAEAKEAALRIMKDVTRASDIINRIALLFKKHVPQQELVDVNGVIQEMIALLRSEATRYSVSIHSELSNGLPKIMADRVGLQQVLMNLMLNAIEAMKEIGAPGALTIATRVDENGQILVSITDTGIGLPYDRGEQIFDPFFTSKSQGTGMGLPISRSIIESHGGRLWATANSGRGATFQFTLPVEAAIRQSA